MGMFSVSIFGLYFINPKVRRGHITHPVFSKYLQDVEKLFHDSPMKMFEILYPAGIIHLSHRAKEKNSRISRFSVNTVTTDVPSTTVGKVLRITY